MAAAQGWVLSKLDTVMNTYLWLVLGGPGMVEADDRHNRGSWLVRGAEYVGPSCSQPPLLCLPSASQHAWTSLEEPATCKAPSRIQGMPADGIDGSPYAGIPLQQPASKECKQDITEPHQESSGCPPGT